MIYVKISAAFKNSGRNIKEHGAVREYENLIKIGYCEDKNESKRSSSYRTENPTIDTLYIIPNGTRNDEKCLHIYFKEFKAPYGSEWFYDKKEIYDFFDIHTDIEEIRSFLKGEGVFYHESSIDRLESEIIVNVVSSVIYGKDILENMDKIRNLRQDICNLKFPSKEDIFRYLRLKLKFSRSQINRIKSRYSQINEIKKSLSTYFEEFNCRTEFPDKLRYICEEMGVSEEVKLRFLDIIPIQFKNAYLTLGPRRCRALGYRKSRIEEDYMKLVIKATNATTIDSYVYNRFEVGKRYTREYIKESLVEIYKSVNLTSNPKASDLEKWFEIKPTKIPNPATGKRDHGFEIVSRKE